MKIAIDSAVFGLVPVPVQAATTFEVAERPLICREGNCCAVAAAHSVASPASLPRLALYFPYMTPGSHRTICGKMMSRINPSTCRTMNCIMPL
jgi:hypothetical protein